jgi:hypothetical protein
LDGNKLLRVFGDELKFHVRLDAYIGAGREGREKGKPGSEKHQPEHLFDWFV